MKRIALLWIIAGCVLACQPAEEASNEIIITGQIENSKGDSIVFQLNDRMEKYAVNEDGSFKGQFETHPGYYQFSYNREYATCYLSPGDSLHIRFNTQEFDESMSYSGTKAQENNYLAEKFLLLEEIGQAKDIRQLYTMPEDSFLMSVNQEEDKVLALLNGKELDPEFKETETSNIKYEYLSELDRYELYHGYFTKNDTFEISPELKTRLASIDFTNEKDFKSIPAYRDFVIAHFSGGELSERLEELADVESRYIREETVEEITRWLSPGTENIKQNIDAMKAMVQDTELLKSLTEKYEDFKALARGSESPSFEFRNVRDEMVALEDLKGKNVYIDVWATWCGPCKAEIPHLKELEGEYHGKDIEFVSISVDVPEDEQKWKDMVAEKELKGIQLMSDNGWETSFVESYIIKGIPRFILLDSEGKIVSADAPRPSSKTKIREMIDALLVGA